MQSLAPPCPSLAALPPVQAAPRGRRRIGVPKQPVWLGGRPLFGAAAVLTLALLPIFFGVSSVRSRPVEAMRNLKQDPAAASATAAGGNPLELPAQGTAGAASAGLGAAAASGQEPGAALRSAPLSRRRPSQQSLQSSRRRWIAGRPAATPPGCTSSTVSLFRDWPQRRGAVAHSYPLPSRPLLPPQVSVRPARRPLLTLAATRATPPQSSLGSGPPSWASTPRPSWPSAQTFRPGAIPAVPGELLSRAPMLAALSELGPPPLCLTPTPRWVQHGLPGGGQVHADREPRRPRRLLRGALPGDLRPAGPHSHHVLRDSAGRCQLVSGGLPLPGLGWHSGALLASSPTVLSGLTVLSAVCLAG